jgi:hypothetical protein
MSYKRINNNVWGDMAEHVNVIDTGVWRWDTYSDSEKRALFDSQSEITYKIGTCPLRLVYTPKPNVPTFFKEPTVDHMEEDRLERAAAQERGTALGKPRSAPAVVPKAAAADVPGEFEIRMARLRAQVEQLQGVKARAQESGDESLQLINDKIDVARRALSDHTSSTKSDSSAGAAALRRQVSDLEHHEKDRKARQLQYQTDVQEKNNARKETLRLAKHPAIWLTEGRVYVKGASLGNVFDATFPGVPINYEALAALARKEEAEDLQLRGIDMVRRPRSEMLEAHYRAVDGVLLPFTHAWFAYRSIKQEIERRYHRLPHVDMTAAQLNDLNKQRVALRTMYHPVEGLSDNVQKVLRVGRHKHDWFPRVKGTFQLPWDNFALTLCMPYIVESAKGDDVPDEYITVSPHALFAVPSSEVDIEATRMIGLVDTCMNAVDIIVATLEGPGPRPAYYNDMYNDEDGGVTRLRQIGWFRHWLMELKAFKGKDVLVEIKITLKTTTLSAPLVHTNRGTSKPAIGKKGGAFVFRNLWRK